MSLARNLARLAATGITTCAVNQDLRNLIIYDEDFPRMAQTKGGTLVGDGEGGMWRWQADSVGVDNGQNVLLPMGQSSSVPGRWIRQSDETGTQVFSTTQDLRDFALVTTANYDTAQTLGAKGRGDGGGGLWRWEPARTDVDNFGVFLLPTGQNISDPGRWIRQRRQNEVNASWWGLVTGGVVDSYPALSQAIAYAETLEGGTTSIETAIIVEIPAGEYLCNSELLINKNGVTLSGPIGGRGPVLSFPDKGVRIGVQGDYTDRLTGCGLNNLQLACTNKTSTTSVGLTLWRVTSCDIINTDISGFAINVDCYRATTTTFQICRIQSTGRTANATALMRLQGTDETEVVPPQMYSPGGGMHITDCEIQGITADDTNLSALSGILVHSVDGLYISQTHIGGCNVALNIQPQGTPENHVIATIMVSNVYFDGPSGSPVTGANVIIGGKVKTGILMGDGTTQNASMYIDIVFASTYFRAAGDVNSNLKIDIEDLDTWGATKFIEPLQISNCEFRRAKGTAISCPVSSDVKPNALMVSNCFFDEYNEDAVTDPDQASAIGIRAHSLQISNCMFKNDAASTAYIVLLYDPVDSAIITGNDFSQSKSTSSVIRQTPSDVANTVLLDNNIFPGYGRNLKLLEKITTTNATPTTKTIYSVSEGNAGYIDCVITGSTLTGKTIAAHYNGFYRRLGTAGMVLSTGTDLFKLVEPAWNPDGLPSVPVLQGDGSAIEWIVAGLAAETWYWVANINIVEST